MCTPIFSPAKCAEKGLCRRCNTRGIRAISAHRRRGPKMLFWIASRRPTSCQPVPHPWRAKRSAWSGNGFSRPLKFFRISRALAEKNPDESFVSVVPCLAARGFIFFTRAPEQKPVGKLSGDDFEHFNRLGQTMTCCGALVRAPPS